ncbi:MAG: RraA family protein [Aestuariivirga sp.]
MAVTVNTARRAELPAPLLERLRKVPVAIIADVSAGACLIDPAIRPLQPPGKGVRLFGRAVTARCAAPDFGAVLHALDLVGEGDVLVIDAQGNRDHAMIGGILGGHLRRIGAAGVVCDGAVRDVMELAAWDDFAVFSRSITPRGPTAWEQGEVNGTVTIGGRAVGPGDLIIGDDDGLVALTAEEANVYIDKAEQKLALEAKWIDSLASGQSVAQVFGLPK